MDNTSLEKMKKNSYSLKKNFKCNHCDYASAWKNDLRKHTKSHLGDKSYKVNRCLARYSPRATTTNQPTNRALNKPAWPGPI